MSNLQRFRSVVSTILYVPPEQVTDELSPEVVDTWDSLNHINLISALEQEFGVTLPAESLSDSPTVGRLKKLMIEHGVTLNG